MSPAKSPCARLCRCGLQPRGSAEPTSSWLGMGTWRRRLVRQRVGDLRKQCLLATQDPPKKQSCRLEQSEDRIVGNPVVGRRSFTTTGHKPVGAQDGEMLGCSAGVQTERHLKAAHGALPVSEQFNDANTRRVTEDAKYVCLERVDGARIIVRTERECVWTPFAALAADIRSQWAILVSPSTLAPVPATRGCNCCSPSRDYWMCPIAIGHKHLSSELLLMQAAGCCNLTAV
jgi:hypothetical protein